MRRRFAITGVMLLATAVVFVVASEGGGPFATTVKGTWSGYGYNVGQGNCPEGSLESFSIGKGFMTLTGKSEWFAEGCLDPTTGFSVGTAVITAANGDLLFLTTATQLIPDSPEADFGTWSQEEETIGGTGRFEGATGSGMSSGTYQFNGPIDVWTGTNEAEITL